MFLDFSSNTFRLVIGYFFPPKCYYISIELRENGSSLGAVIIAALKTDFRPDECTYI